MKVQARQITAYIDHLRETGFTVTLHGDFINNSEFLQYNYHQNPYCHYIKSVYGKWGRCICHQKKVMRRAEEGAFFGCCHAGVGEFVYPVSNGEKTACFISVSGYFSESTLSKLTRFGSENGIDPKELSMLSNKYLNRNIPLKNAVDTVIEPLVIMLEVFFRQKSELCSDETTLYHKVLRYVTENCHSNLTMKELAKEFHYSVSSLSHLFLKKTGKSLPEYVNDLRLNEAKWYLANSKTSISEIAMFLGYSSSNYFSTVFKNRFGITPKDFRKGS